MDETLTRCALDLSNRPYLIWKVAFSRPKVGEMDTELFKEWFHAFARTPASRSTWRPSTARTTTTSSRSCFKGLARALREAVAIDPRRADEVPSTKGVLGGSL